MNKTLASWLSVVVVFLCLPLFAWNGSGTYEDPYEIATASDVADLVVAVNGGADQSGIYFLQTADIDLSTFGNFTPIGLPSAPFQGSYDGDGYRISNMTRNATITASSGETYHGLFGYIYGASLANIVVDGSVKIVSTSSTSSGIRAYCGGVVGRANGQCFLEALESYVDITYINTVLGLANNTMGTVGGVVGRSDSDNNLTWIGLVNHGNIYFEEAVNSQIGGVIGFLSKSYGGNPTTLVGCENHGKLSSFSHATLQCGGICHNNNAKASVLNKCYNYGDICITGIATHVGGLFSQADSGNSFNALVSPKYCANYGNITLVDGFGGSHAVSAMGGGSSSYGGESFDYSTNYGNIRIEAVDINLCEVGSFLTYGGRGISNPTALVGCVNYGDITYISTKANGAEEVSLGGISAPSRTNTASEFLTATKCENHGKITLISANTSASAKYGIAGVGCVSSPTDNADRYSVFNNCVNFGTLVMEVPNDFQGVADISGVCSAYSEQKCDVRLNWCYNLGSLKWSGNNVYVGGLMGLEDAETSADEYTHINHSYSVCSYNGSLEGNYVGSIVGYAKSVTGPITISNSFGVAINRSLPAFGYFDNAYTNNVKGYAWEEVYRDLNISGFYLPSSKFNQPTKTTTYYDLICPMNTEIFPTDTDEVKRLHNAVLVNGYKRYIRTIQQ